MPLSVKQIQQTKPTTKQFKLYDSKGLFLLVHPNGSKYWRLRYNLDGKEKTLALGVFPAIPLAEARKRRDEARAKLAQGIDPGLERQAAKALASGADSFERVAMEYLAKQAGRLSPSHMKRQCERLQNDVFPWIGAQHINSINAPALLEILRRIEARGAIETASRIRTLCSQIFRYGLATGRCDRDPAADLRGALTPAPKRHYPAPLKLSRIGEILRASDGYQGTLVVRTALRLAPLVFVRPGDLRQAQWQDIDFEETTWSLVAEKRDTPLIVPLSRQAVALLRDLYPLTGNGRFVFPGARSDKRPMSDNALLMALRTMGITKDEMVGHSWRAIARTLLAERLGVRAELIEQQISHVVRDPMGRAYNRTQFLDERREMMQAWADFLDELRKG